MIIRIL